MKKRVLILCTANSARSQMAEGGPPVRIWIGLSYRGLRALQKVSC